MQPISKAKCVCSLISSTQEMSKHGEFKLLKIQTCILRVNIHCDGCKQQVKKLLHKIEGVYMVSIDAEQQKVTISASVEPATLMKKLVRAGKPAELWSTHKSANVNNNKNKQKLTSEYCYYEDDDDDADIEAARELQFYKEKAIQLAMLQQQIAMAAANKAPQAIIPNNENHPRVSHEEMNAILQRKRENDINSMMGLAGAASSLGANNINNPSAMLKNMNGSQNRVQQQAAQNQMMMYQRSPFVPLNTAYYYHHDQSAAAAATHLFSDENTSSCCIM